MRILYLAADAVPSPKGAGVRIERTVRTLMELGHEVRLLTFAPRTTPSGSGQEASLDGVDHDTVSSEPGNFLQRMVGFRHAAGAWLQGQEADLVQFRGIWEGIPAVAWARGVGARIVFEAHGFPSIELPYHYPALVEEPELLEKLVLEEGAVLGQADLVLTHSRTGSRYLTARGVRRERIGVVPNAVDPELFAPSDPPAEGSPFRVVYVGTLAPWQGLLMLLEALTRFRREGQVELHVIGPLKGAWRRQLRAHARQARVHHMVQLSGATTQQNLVPVLRSAHLCVAPMPADARNTVQGCCPIKVLEYMAAGRPILGTRIAPLLELLSHARDAWLAPPGSPASLAAGLRWLLDHPKEREALGERAREAAVARFTPLLFQTRLARALERLGEAV